MKQMEDTWGGGGLLLSPGDFPPGHTFIHSLSPWSLSVGPKKGWLVFISSYKRVNHLIPRNELGREGLKGDSEAPPSLILYKD